MGFDLLTLGLLALFVFMGSRRGAVAAGTGLTALVVGYAGAVWAASRLASPVSAQLNTPEILGPPIAGTIGFLVCFTFCSLVGGLLRRIDRLRLGELKRTGLDRFAGGVFGALRGGLIVVLLSVLALWVDAARQLEVSGFASAPPLGSSRVAQASGAVVELVVEKALADVPMARVAAKVVAHPAEALKGVQRLVDYDGFEEIQADTLFWKYIQHGAIDNALARSSFIRLSQDAGLREELAMLAVITQEEASDSKAFRDAIGEALSKAAPRIRALSEDRSLQQLAEDPEIVELLRNGDTFALITHPKIREVVQRVSAEL